MEVKNASCPFCGFKIHEEDSRELPRKRDEHLKSCNQLMEVVEEMKAHYTSVVSDFGQISEAERNDWIHTLLRGHIDSKLRSFIGGMRCKECGRYIEIPLVGRHDTAYPVCECGHVLDGIAMCTVHAAIGSQPEKCRRCGGEYFEHLPPKEEFIIDGKIVKDYHGKLQKMRFRCKRCGVVDGETDYDGCEER